MTDPSLEGQPPSASDASPLVTMLPASCTGAPIYHLQGAPLHLRKRMQAPGTLRQITLTSSTGAGDSITTRGGLGSSLADNASSMKQPAFRRVAGKVWKRNKKQLNVARSSLRSRGDVELFFVALPNFSDDSPERGLFLGRILNLFRNIETQTKLELFLKRF